MVYKKRDTPKEVSDHEKISPTAQLCAQARALYTDIPFAKEIVSGLSENGLLRKINLTEKEKNLSLRPIMSVLEGRHLAISETLNETSGPILEIASGLSSRALEYCHKRPYVETDLPEMAKLKRKIISYSPHQILPLNPLNYLELEGLSINQFQGEEITIVNEGLLMYLSHEEQKTLGRNISILFKKYFPKGHWITTDFSSRDLKEEKAVSLMKTIEMETERKFNRFSSDDEVHDFLLQANLIGTPIPNSHLLSKLSCIRRLQIPEEEALALAPIYRAWKISLK